MIKLICTDIDGTLVGEGNTAVKQEVFDVILKLKATGIHFAAASGRPAASVEKVFEPIKEKIFYITDNGSYIGSYRRELFINGIERDLAFEVIEDIHRCCDCDVMICGRKHAYLERRSEYFIHRMIDLYHFDAKVVDDLLDVKDDILKISMFHQTDIAGISAPIFERWRDRLQVMTSGACWVDIVGKSVNKGYAISVVQEALDILPEETLVFGDQENDIEMMKRAAYSFAVANARPEVKAAARFETDSYKEDGVLKVLKKLLHREAPFCFNDCENR
jgi:Cof subfamily protein (haloacid dehalogenase superfamily)